MITLDLIKKNQKVKVISIFGGKNIRQRLSGLGIHIDDTIIVLRNICMQSPILINIHGNQVALGTGIAKKILVELE